MGPEQALLRHLRPPQAHASENSSGHAQEGHRPRHRRHSCQRHFKGRVDRNVRE